MTDALTMTRRRAMQALNPPPVLSLADWIGSTIHFPATVSVAARKGPALVLSARNLRCD